LLLLPVLHFREVEEQPLVQLHGKQVAVAVQAILAAVVELVAVVLQELVAVVLLL
jgi:hypothetical protein